MNLRQVLPYPYLTNLTTAKRAIQLISITKTIIQTIHNGHAIIDII